MTLWHDPEANKFAVKIADEADDNAYPIWFNGLGNQSYITPRAFIERFGLSDAGTVAATYEAGLLEFVRE